MEPNQKRHISGVEALVRRVLDEERVRNELANRDGVVTAIAGDGKTATVKLSGDTTATPNVGIPKHVAGTLAVNDRVRVQTYSPRDMWILFVKP
jgi:hypothetical protein